MQWASPRGWYYEVWISLGAVFFTLYAYGGGIIGNVSVGGWVVYLAVFRIMVDGRELMSLHGEEIVGISIVG